MVRAVACFHLLVRRDAAGLPNTLERPRQSTGTAFGSAPGRFAVCGSNDGDPVSGAEVCCCSDPLAPPACLTIALAWMPVYFRLRRLPALYTSIAGQAARSPFPVGCLPVPDGMGPAGPSSPMAYGHSPHSGARQYTAIPIMLGLCAGISVGWNWDRAFRQMATPALKRIHPLPAASSPGCLPVIGWKERPLSRP